MDLDDLIIEIDLEAGQYTAAFLALARQVEMDDNASDLEKMAGRLLERHFGIGETAH